ncbi:unnamed protein product [Rhizophagus irregularis]|nr:unnamed protein product [Rhizophagus irregularis]
MINAQHWLDIYYSDKSSKNIIYPNNVRFGEMLTGEELIIKDYPQLEEITITPPTSIFCGNKITELSLEEQKELINLNISGNLLAKSLFSFFEEKKSNYSVLTGTRKILLVGQTGSGKSTLANVLSRTNEFEEGKTLVSKTNETQTKEFEIEVNSKYFENEKIKFEVVDTIGFSDTVLTTKEVLREVEKTCQEIKNDLSQVLFIIKERFTEEEFKIY